MEIRIDTNKDSKEEIKKIIKFLNEVVDGSSSSYSSASVDSVPDAEPSMFGMFSDDSSNTTVGDINIQTKEDEYEAVGVWDSSTQKTKSSSEPEPKIDIIPY